MAKNRDPQPDREAPSEYDCGTESESEESEHEQPTPPLSQIHANTEVVQKHEAPSQPDPVAVVQKRGSIKKWESTASKSKPLSLNSKLTGIKRGADVNALSAEEDSKKVKKVDTLAEKENVSDAKKVLFRRIWSDDDEIVLLRGMLDYAEEKEADPYVEITSFHDYVRNKMQVVVNKEQLRRKIRAIKEKFTKKQSKEVDGKDLIFSKPHERLVYQLAKQIWGGNCNTEIAVGSLTPKVPLNAKMTKEKDLSEHRNDVKLAEVSNTVKPGTDCDTVQKLPSFEAPQWLGELALKLFGREMFEGGKVRESSKEWKIMKHREMDIYLELQQLNVDKTRLVFNAMKSDDL